MSQTESGVVPAAGERRSRVAWRDGVGRGETGDRGWANYVTESKLVSEAGPGPDARAVIVEFEISHLTFV